MKGDMLSQIFQMEQKENAKKLGLKMKPEKKSLIKIEQDLMMSLSAKAQKSALQSGNPLKKKIDESIVHNPYDVNEIHWPLFNPLVSKVPIYDKDLFDK